MQRYIYAFLVLLGLTFAPSAAQQPSKGEKVLLPEQKTIYLFGISQNLTDTIVYVSEVCEVPNAQLSKNGFLARRKEYSEQFRAHLEKTLGTTQQTPAVIFTTERAKTEKALVKAFKKLNEQKVAGRKLIVRMVPRSEFQFRLPTMVGQ